MEPHLDEHQLIRRLVDGDPAAMAPLYDRHAGVVFASILRVVKDRSAAEELVQETFVLAWRHAERFDPARGRVIPWLLAIAHHLALNELRRRRRRPEEVGPVDPDRDDDPLQAIPDPGPEPAEVAWAAVRRQALVQALADISVEQRRVIELYGEGYSQSEIATRLGEPLGTVKTRMRRGMERLRGLLAGQDLDVD